MKRMTVGAIVCAITFLCFALSASGQIPFRGKKDDQKKESERDQKNQLRFDKLKEYATNRYNTDPDFHEQVDQAYEDLMREHSDRAYEKNIGRGSYLKTVHEDSWRMHVNLYDNLMVQDLVNEIGQRLVPEGSEKLFAFKVVADPVPSAETLATGTIYVSTGMISLLDNESQLAYVLAHEMAHGFKEHWKERVLLREGEEEYNKEQGRKVARWALLGSVAGGVAGATLGKSISDTIGGAAGGGAIGLLTGVLLNRPLIVNWDKEEEDEADEVAFKSVLRANYDVREVPKLYAAMEKAVVRDTRVGLGFLGSRRRVLQRRETAERLIATSYKADIDTKLKSAQMVGDSAEYRNLMAELKRDNGILAYYHDMFEMARRNLEEAALIRDNDPAVHYYHGKILKLVGRTPEDHKNAMSELAKAEQFDYRKQNYGTSLHRALSMIEEDPQAHKAEIVKELNEYVTNYARWNVERWQLRYFPPNMDTIYEYMRLYGDPGWRPQAPDAKDLPNYSALLALGTPDGVEPVHEQPKTTSVQANAPTAAPTVKDAVKGVLNQVHGGKAGQIGAAASSVMQRKR